MNVAGLLRSFLFFFNDTATTEIYTLSLHDALPIYLPVAVVPNLARYLADIKRGDLWIAAAAGESGTPMWKADLDRKSTRLNSSHSSISYAVFCLKKKKKIAIK